MKVAIDNAFDLSPFLLPCIADESSVSLQFYDNLAIGEDQ